MKITNLYKTSLSYHSQWDSLRQTRSTRRHVGRVNQPMRFKGNEIQHGTQGGELRNGTTVMKLNKKTRTNIEQLLRLPRVDVRQFCSVFRRPERQSK